MALLAALLDPRLFGGEIKDRGQPVSLPALEAALVEKSVPKRQREFALGRACARHALEKLGHGSAVIGRQVPPPDSTARYAKARAKDQANHLDSLIGSSRAYAGPARRRDLTQSRHDDPRSHPLTAPDRPLHPRSNRITKAP